MVGVGGVIDLFFFVFAMMRGFFPSVSEWVGLWEERGVGRVICPFAPPFFSLPRTTVFSFLSF